MIKLYFKQAWQLLKQNPLFSSIYILGTGLSIALTMTVVIIYYIKMAPVYPEWNRDRILVSKGAAVYDRKDEGNYSSGYLSYAAVRDYFYPLAEQGAEAVTAIQHRWGEYPTVEFPGELGVQPVQMKYTDAHFWQVFDCSFTAGKPFTEADFQSGLRTAVVSQSIARKLFANEEAVGRTFLLNDDEYRISGIIRDVSYITPASFADVWIPFTVDPEAIQPQPWAHGLLGDFQVYILARDKKSMAEIKQAMDEKVQKLNASQEEYRWELHGQPAPYWKSVFYVFSDSGPDWHSLIRMFGTMLLALLLIPALNLAGMISSRMDHRLAELGVRKAFGASKGRLLNQVLTENLLLTLLGGITGLVLSYLMIYTGRNWLPSLFVQYVTSFPEQVDTFFTFDMLFNPMVFGITFAICLVLNTLSAIIPAWHALRKEIVYSLNDKK